VTLPSCAEAVKTIQAHVPGPTGGNETVLLVDDEPEVAMMLRDVLSTDGYEVVIVRNGADALDILRMRHFDVILCDIRMPKLDGPGLLRVLQARHPEMARKLILMTGDVLRAAAVLPPDIYVGLLEKPVDPAEVRRRVRDLIDEYPPSTGGR
jgi:CheY-like chemotaxis protein